MKYVLEVGINPQSKLTELALMRLSVAIRAAVGFNKKVVFKLMVEMKNGCIWLCYSVDGVKCSTFVKAKVFAMLILQAKYQLSEVLSEYVNKLRVQFPGTSISYDGDDNCVILGVIQPKGIKQIYLMADVNNNWALYERKTSSTPIARFTSIPTVISYLANNSI